MILCFLVYSENVAEHNMLKATKTSYTVLHFDKDDKELFGEDTYNAMIRLIYWLFDSGK